jgi:hypothetical protein
MINDTASKDLQEKLQFESRIQLGQMLREQSAPELDWPQSRDPISYRGDSPKPKRQLSTPAELSGCCALYIFHSHS